MSLVGPRPERPEFVSELTVAIPFYGQRHVVRPGLTGWAQVCYAYGASVDDAMQKLQYDLFYIKHMSLGLDLYIAAAHGEDGSFRGGESDVRDEEPSHRVLNAMTIDVEDYFHVSAFDGVVPRSRWETLESRVCANTERVLGILDDAGVRATFFVLGWVAERHPELVRRIAERGHELASHGYAHRLVYDQTPAAFREDVRQGEGAPRGRVRRGR